MGCIVSSDAKGGDGKVAPYPVDSAPKNNKESGTKPVAAAPDASYEEAAAAEALAGAMVDGATEGSVFQRYSVGHTLGTGGYSVVKLGIDKQTKEKVAIKIIKLSDEVQAPVRRMSTTRKARTSQQGSTVLGSMRAGPDGKSSKENGQPNMNASSSMQPVSPKVQEELTYLVREIKLLQSLKHPSLCELREYYLSSHSTRLYLVLELLEGGELLVALQKRGWAYSESDAQKIMVPVLKGIEYLHAHDIAHRDLKLENLILKDPADLSSVKIADFGLAKNSRERQKGATDNVNGTICGTPMYMAPEILRREKGTFAVDMWSLGVIMYALLTGSMPFVEDDVTALFQLIVKGKYDMTEEKWSGVSEEARSLVRGFLTDDPNQRLTASQALRHPWLTTKDLSKTALARDKNSLDVVSAKEFPLRVFNAGELLAKQGDPTDVIYLLRCGRVQLSFLTADAAPGSSPNIVEELGPGSYVGEWSVLDDARVDVAALEAIRLPRADGSKVDIGDGDIWPANVVALEHVEAIVMKRQQMLWILEHDNDAKAEVKRQGFELASKLNAKIHEVLAQRRAAGVPGGSAMGAGPNGAADKQVTDSQRIKMAEALMT